MEADSIQINGINIAAVIISKIRYRKNFLIRLFRFIDVSFFCFVIISLISVLPLSSLLTSSHMQTV